jgi:hypothetical protein
MYRVRARNLVAVISVTFVAALGVTARAAAPSRANVVLGASPDIPLRLVNFSFNTSRPDMLAFHYDVENTSGQGLVAVEVKWRAEFDNGSEVSISNRDDRWLPGQLPAGGQERFQVSNVPDAGGQPVTKLVATVTFAEFEDGTRLGTNAAAVGKEIGAARRATIASYAKLLTTFNRAGSEALVEALRLSSAGTNEIPAVQEANARLLSILADHGIDAVVLELERVSTLTLPDSGV